MNNAEFQIKLKKYHSERMREVLDKWSTGDMPVQSIASRLVYMEAELIRYEYMRTNDYTMLPSFIMRDTEMLVDDDNETFKQMMGELK